MDVTPWKPNFLVLGPGGIRGLYIAGALHRLKTKQRLTDVKGYGCSSVGAVIALEMITSYEPIEIITMGTDTNLFSDFFSVKLKNTRKKMREMKENRGITSNIQIKRQLEETVVAKMGNIPTLQELYDRTGIEFYVSTYNVTDQKLEIKSHYSDPGMSCVIAVLLSINIPFLFYEISYEGKIYMDAAFVCPLVIFPFEDGHSNILTIFVDVASNTSEEDLTLTEYIHHIMMSPIKMLKDKAIASSSSRCRHLCLVSQFQDITGLTLTAEDKASMVITGLQGADIAIARLDDNRDDHIHNTEKMDEIERINCVSKRIIYAGHPPRVRTLTQIISNT
jgi:predicted acylesterase/phospholipase RssA